MQYVEKLKIDPYIWSLFYKSAKAIPTKGNRTPWGKKQVPTFPIRTIPDNNQMVDEGKLFFIEVFR